jgi:FtsH-binding integral membrane protein
MFGFASFSEVPISGQEQLVASARIIAGTQVITSSVAGATAAANALVVVTTAGSLSTAVGTTVQKVIFLPSGQVVTSSVAGATPEVRIFAGSQALTTAISGPTSVIGTALIEATTNLITGSVSSPSVFTYNTVDDNVTQETWTAVNADGTSESWSEVDTDSSTETWNNA